MTTPVSPTTPELVTAAPWAAGLKRARWLAAALLLAALAVRLWWAATAPLANDEAYYWDWSRALQLSYLDHPPAVAWLAAGGTSLASGLLGARLLMPFVHLIGVLLLWASAREIKGAALTPTEVLRLLAVTELVPAFSLEGVLLLPDGSLLAAMAGALYAFLRAAGSKPGRSYPWLVPAGLSLGLAGLSKYHAAPLALGLAAGLAVYWRGRQRLGEGCGFLLGSALIAVLVTTPVWLWNAAHDWASLRFQGAHGFSGLTLEWLPALRFYLGQTLLLTPLITVYMLAQFKRAWPAAGALPDKRLIGIWAALPLVVLLETLAFGKQLLPHWLAPAAWMLAPALALHVSKKKLYRLNFVFAALITCGLPWVLTLRPLRQALIASFHGRPGPLSELTLWEPLAQAAVQDPVLGLYLRPRGFASKDPLFGTSTSSCPGGMKLASLRWFWSAQLAFHLPGQPRVLSLDFNHPSYYSYRDSLPAFADCPVLIIADARHLDEGLLAKALLNWRRVPFSVPSHQDTDVAVLLGRFRSEPELRTLQASLGAAYGAEDTHAPAP